MKEDPIVEVPLLDEKSGETTIYQLRPLLSARRAVNRYAGGYTGMFKAIQGYDVDAMTYVIVAGTGASGRPAAIIEERVYATPVDTLMKPLVKFLNICANGGREPEETDVKTGTGSNAGND